MDYKTFLVIKADLIASIDEDITHGQVPQSGKAEYYWMCKESYTSEEIDAVVDMGGQVMREDSFIKWLKKLQYA